MTYQADVQAANSGNAPFMYELSLGGQGLSLFTHSFLGFGQDAALSLSIKSAALGLKIKTTESQKVVTPTSHRTCLS